MCNPTNNLSVEETLPIKKLVSGNRVDLRTEPERGWVHRREEENQGEREEDRTKHARWRKFQISSLSSANRVHGFTYRLKVYNTSYNYSLQVPTTLKTTHYLTTHTTKIQNTEIQTSTLKIQ